MKDLSNALQDKLVSRKGSVKSADDGQLDLFASLAERAAPPPQARRKKSEGRAASPESVPPASAPPPPDVSADVRAALSESAAASTPEETPVAREARRPPLRTGIYRRPERLPLARHEPPPPPASAGYKRNPWHWLRDWFAGAQIDRRLVSLVIVLVVLVASVAYWTSCPRKVKPKPGAVLDLREIYRQQPAVEEPAAPQQPALADPTAAAATAAAPAAKAPGTIPAGEWKISGVTTTISGNTVLLTCNAPVFVSLAYISKEGMSTLKAVAAKLKTLKNGAQVIVTGYTDNVPLSAPTAKFKSNADIAAARAKTAREHLAAFARPARGLTFTDRAGDPAHAPFPNDTLQNRQLNRTVTIQIIPTP